jgi:hypothetical protein
MNFDYKFWLPLLVSLAYLYFMRQQVLLMKGSQQASANMTIGSRLKPYWPIMVMVLLFIGCWVPYFLASSAVPQYFLGWSTLPTGGAFAEIDSSLLASHKGNRRVMIVGVAIDSSIDPMNDPNIMKSRTYEIELPVTRLEAQPTPEFLASETPGRNVQLFLIETPEEFAIEHLITLSDVGRLGGTILGHAGFTTSGIQPMPSR